MSITLPSFRVVAALNAPPPGLGLDANGSAGDDPMLLLILGLPILTGLPNWNIDVGAVLAVFRSNVTLFVLDSFASASIGELKVNS